MSTQDILTWTFTPNAAQPPAAPSSLGAAPAGATSVNLSWTNNATNQAGFYLDRATDGGFTQNLVTQTLAASATSFTDAAAGLAPGGTFYYRIRAFNSAGARPTRTSRRSPSRWRRRRRAAPRWCR